MTTALDLDLKKLRSRAFDTEEWAEGVLRRYHARKGLFTRGHGENGGKPVWEIWACNASNYKPIVQKYGLTLGLRLPAQTGHQEPLRTELPIASHWCPFPQRHKSFWRAFT